MQDSIHPSFCKNLITDMEPRDRWNWDPFLIQPQSLTSLLFSSACCWEHSSTQTSSHYIKLSPGKFDSISWLLKTHHLYTKSDSDGDTDRDSIFILCSLPRAAALQLLPVPNPSLPNQTALDAPAPTAHAGSVLVELGFPTEGWTTIRIVIPKASAAKGSRSKPLFFLRYL